MSGMDILSKIIFRVSVLRHGTLSNRCVLEGKEGKAFLCSGSLFFLLLTWLTLAVAKTVLISGFTELSCPPVPYPDGNYIESA